jgi:hypothetical protein
MYVYIYKEKEREREREKSNEMQHNTVSNYPTCLRNWQATTVITVLSELPTASLSSLIMGMYSLLQNSINTLMELAHAFQCRKCKHPKKPFCRDVNEHII